MNSAHIDGGEAVYRILREHRIDAVFGLLGGSMLELYDAIHRGGAIAYIGARDERAAGHMADAYARMRGAPGIVLGAQAGPGVVNLATAVAEAHLAYSPLVAIAGAIQRSDQGVDTFQEIDQVALFAPICKRSILIADAARLADGLRDAIRLAMSGRRGPVVVHVPRDLFAARAPFAPREVAAPHPAALEAQAAEAITAALARAEAPVIVAGGGIKWSRGDAHLRALAESLQVPVIASTGHADVLPHRHPLHAGQAGPRGNRVAAGLLRDADFVLALGTRLGFNTTFLRRDAIAPTAWIAQIDIEESAIGRYFPVALGARADAACAARAIAQCAAQRGLTGARWAKWRAAFETARDALAAERDAEGAIADVPLAPRRVLAEIREAMTPDAITTLDTGNACLQAADRGAHHRCPSLLTPLDFGLVGFGYAAAIGASVACPQRPVVAVCGDGGFGFALSEINTAVQYQLPVIAVVLDNGAWGAEKAYQQTFFGGRLLGADIASARFDQVAQLCGADGYRAERPGETAAALTAALARRRPAVIHAAVDPNALAALRTDLFADANENANENRGGSGAR